MKLLYALTPNSPSHTYPYKGIVCPFMCWLMVWVNGAQYF